MKLVHYNPAEISYEVLHRFVTDYASIYPEVFGALGVDERARKLHANAHIYAYVEEGGRIAAAIFFYCNDYINHMAFVTSIAKLDNAPHRAGSELMMAYEDFAKREGMLLSRLEVGSENQRAQAFYLKQGYIQRRSLGENLILEKKL